MGRCQNCGIEAPTEHVVFHQNVGVVIMRFSKKLQGSMCKACIRESFWSYTLKTLFLGWWGIISFFVTLFVLPSNLYQYSKSFKLPDLPPGTRRPEARQFLGEVGAEQD